MGGKIGFHAISRLQSKEKVLHRGGGGRGSFRPIFQTPLPLGMAPVTGAPDSPMPTGGGGIWVTPTFLPLSILRYISWGLCLFSNSIAFGKSTSQRTCPEQ